MKHDLRPMVIRRFRWLPPRPYAMLMHLLYHGQISTFRHPKTFTQLLVARKLEDRNPLWRTTSDKLAVRSYVSERIGDEHLIPLLQVVDDPRDIDFDSLKAPYVIKATHGYNMNIFVTDDKDLDRQAIIRKTSDWLNTDFYVQDSWKEWVYSAGKPKLMIEQFIGHDGKAPDDYKFYVFNGRVGMIQHDADRFINHKSTHFDRDWNQLDIWVRFRPADNPPERPAALAKLLEIAEKLAEGLEFVRIDLYNVDGHVYFGEITHSPGGGIIKFNPRAIDIAMGELWRNGTPIPASLRKKKRQNITTNTSVAS